MEEIKDPTILPPSQTNPLINTQSSAASSGTQIIYTSKMMDQLMNLVDRVAVSNAAVLILGESGTGKDLIARAIHERSNRKNKPFVVINCSALRETLLESELFGHEKGAFTGAYNRKIGLAEVADGGTLFLDEIGELTPAIQAKLLRFLQEGEIFRVGGKDRIKVDVRFISATNRDLEEDVRRGTFREDLFYRINTIIPRTPALRQRREDIPILIDYFLSHGAHRYLKRGLRMSPEALDILVKYDWPGNVRELQNLCDRLQILTEGHTIAPGDLPDHIRENENSSSRLVVDDFDPALSLYELEKRYILKALQYYQSNKTKAAQALGITIKTLYNKLHEYGAFDKFSMHPKDASE